jgi:hypothetical protein
MIRDRRLKRTIPRGRIALRAIDVNRGDDLRRRRRHDWRPASHRRRPTPSRSGPTAVQRHGCNLMRWHCPRKEETCASEKSSAEQGTAYSLLPRILLEIARIRIQLGGSRIIKPKGFRLRGDDHEHTDLGVPWSMGRNKLSYCNWVAPTLWPIWRPRGQRNFFRFLEPCLSPTQGDSRLKAWRVGSDDFQQCRGRPSPSRVVRKSDSRDMSYCLISSLN